MPSDSKMFDVPQNIRKQAERGLELRRKHKRGGLDVKQAKKEGVGSGVQRASDLKSGRVSYKTIKRMNSFLSRHRQHKDRREENGEASAGMIAYLLWGGEPAYHWVRRIIKQEEKVEKGSIQALLYFGDEYPSEEENVVEKSKTPFMDLLRAVQKKEEEDQLDEDQEGTTLDEDETIEEMTEEKARELFETDPPIPPLPPSEEEEEEDPVLEITDKMIQGVKKALKLRRRNNIGSSAHKKVAQSIVRKHFDKLDLNFIKRSLGGLFSNDEEEFMNAQLCGGFEMLESFSKASNPKVPSKYLEGLTGEAREKRKKQIQSRMKGKESYAKMEGDEDVKTKPSKYTRTTFAKKVREEIKGQGKDEFLRASAKVSGISKRILEDVYDRGLKAWATSGHRVGATAQQWAKARVYSFATGGKTQKTADSDLWSKHKKG